MRRSVSCAVLLTVLAAAGCSSSSSPPASPPAGSGRSAPSPTPSTSAPGGLTGIGALEPAWAAIHTPAPEGTATTATIGADGSWDVDPSLESADGTELTYQDVSFVGTPPRLLFFDLFFKPEPLAAAEARVARELPADAVAVSPAQTATDGGGGPQCIGVTYTSATLARVIGGAGAGTVTVAYSTPSGGEVDASSIEEATLIDKAAQNVGAAGYC